MPALVLGHVVVVLRISTDPTEFLSVLKDKEQHLDSQDDTDI